MKFLKKLFHKHEGQVVFEKEVETAYMTYNYRVTVLFCDECKEFYLNVIKVPRN